MTQEDKAEIERISKEFAEGVSPTAPIAGSGWLIVDPLSGYLTVCGFDHTCAELPACDEHPQILVLTFEDGTRFIPAGSDFPHDNSTDWMWIDK